MAPISNRMNDIIQTLLPAAAAAAADHAEPNSELVNLSLADNQLIRGELLDICKSDIAKNLTQEVSSLSLINHDSFLTLLYLK